MVGGNKRSGYNATTDIWLTLNDRYAVLDGEFVELPVAPFAYESRSLVPLRFVSQATGLQVDWDGVNRIINILVQAVQLLVVQLNVQ